MKKITFMAAFCCLTFLSIAQNNTTPSPSVVEKTVTEELSREFVTRANGIDVYYSSVDMSGNELLNIHFTNTSDETKTFMWEVSKESMNFIGRKLITLKPGESFDQNAALEVKGTSDLSNYSIQIILK